MESQLSLFDAPAKTKKVKIYYQDRLGRFASKQQSEIDKLKRKVEYYQFKYEAEYRKNKPIIDRLIESERELKRLKAK